jgi:uncharacterized metal-binding protein YceD (DUF177 family)
MFKIEPFSYTSSNMAEIFDIQTNHLLRGETQEISGAIDPDFLSVADGGILFGEKVTLKGKAYVVDGNLLIHIDVTTSYQAHCRVCNELCTFPLELQGLYLTEELANISSRGYNFKEALREAILIEIPVYAECEGNCPNRDYIKDYLRSS